MALFQKPPQTAEEAEKYAPLDIGPEEVLEMSEEEWYEKIYRGADVPQLTVRAVAMGSVLGFLLAFTNLYIGLKTGWALGVAITACIMSYAIWTFAVKSGVAKSPMTILETNCMQSTASSAGYSTGGTMVSAIAALFLLSVSTENPNGVHMNLWVLSGWTVALAALGTVMAIPMKRNLINRDRLKFPSGTAAAVTLQSLYSHGATALKKAKVLAWSAGAGALFPLFLDFKWKVVETANEATGVIEKTRDTLVGGAIKVFDKVLPSPGSRDVDGVDTPFVPSNWNMVLDANPVMIAAGALVGLRIGFYMLIGGLVLVYGLGQPGMEAKWTSPYGEALNQVLLETEDATTSDAYIAALEPLRETFPGFSAKLKTIQETTPSAAKPEMAVPALMRAEISTLAKAETDKGGISNPGLAWKEVGLWLGVSIMLAYGILQFLTQWRTILAAFTGLGKRDDDLNEAIVAETEVPGSWFAVGTALSGAAAILLAQFAFGIPFYFGALAVGLTFFLAMVAARATGESDITPVGAMGKIMQLTFGTIMPQSTNANLMSASITANAAGSAADLLNDLKSGYLLGANPRRQFIAQIWGIAAGTLATVIGFRLLVQDASSMIPKILEDGTATTPDFPAPAAQAWKAIAEVMTSGGLDAMHPMHRTMIFWGLALGTAMLVLELLLPKQRSWLPSATGIGLGLILPFNYPLSMCLGAVIAAIWTKQNKESSEFYLIPIVSGLIAGISIFGVIGAVMNTFVLK